MRFLLRPAADSLERARPPVRAFLAFSALLVVAAVFQRGIQGGLSPAGLELLFADAQGPGGALSTTVLWEEVHAGAFLDGFLLLTLGSLLAVCPVPPRLRSGLLGAGVASALGDLLLPFLAFRLPGWAALRVGSFALLSASLVAFIVVVWLTFGRAVRRDA